MKNLGNRFVKAEGSFVTEVEQNNVLFFIISKVWGVVLVALFLIALGILNVYLKILSIFDGESLERSLTEHPITSSVVIVIMLWSITIFAIKRK